MHTRTTTPTPSSSYPDNPILVELWRGAAVESVHRGAWVLTDTQGQCLAGAGALAAPFYARSGIKSLQALPLLETGAAERFAYQPAELALALASHDAEAIHTQPVAELLKRMGLSVSDLQCGPQAPGDRTARAELARSGQKPSALHNNCSGKHAGFLALALHLGVAPKQYLQRDSASQQLVRQAVLEMTGLEADQLTEAIDGCSAPTFRMPLIALGRAFARVANPETLPAARRQACQRMLKAVADHPALIAGTRERICTDLARVSGGRLFPKLGGEAVYAIGHQGRDQALAIKIDDGSYRALHALIVALLRRFEWLTPSELAQLEVWEARRLKNWAGLEVGRTQVLL